MENPENRDRQTVAVAFLQRFLADSTARQILDLEDYATMYPGFEDVIEREYRRLTMESVDDVSDADGSVDVRPAGPGGRPSPVGSPSDRASGRYTVVGEIARGGMGVVRKVWDRDLRRYLAMKLLAPRSGETSTGGSDPRSVSRFLDEAQITSQLAHPGIVPVHEVGVSDQGEVFFTMDLVRGRDLGEVIRCVHRSSDGWTLARLMQVLVRVCDAVAFAHAKGVVHRDLKPSNVMVGQFGEVFVMDWGLARVLDGAGPATAEAGDPDRPGPDRAARPKVDAASFASSSLATMEGDVVGTPAYMAPEQARGELERVGPLCDVYSVGAMLYYALTGCVPFVRQAESMSSRTVLARVLEGPPSPVSDFRPDASPALVAVCEKAMARDPAERYASVRQLHDDLDAFLEQRVVQAYETGALPELRSWVRRNRALAMASGAAVLALVVGLIVATVEARHAERSFGVAFRAVDRVMDRVDRLASLGAPQIDRARREMLQDVLESNQALLELRPDDAGLHRELALAHLRIGVNEQRLGDFHAADRAFRAALVKLDDGRVVASDPIVVEVRARARGGLGDLARSAGRPDYALASYDRALAELGAPGASVVLMERRAEILHKAGSVRLARGERGAATRLLGEAHRLRAELAKRDSTLENRVRLASATVEYAVALGPVDRAEQVELFDWAKDRLERIVASDAASRTARFTLGNLCRRYGLLLGDATLQSEAARHLEAASHMPRSVVRDYPEVPLYAGEELNASSHLGWLGGDQAPLLQAIERTRDALDADPTDAFSRGWLLKQHHKLCRVLLFREDYRELARVAERLATVPGHYEVKERAANFINAAARLVRDDDAIDPAERDALAERWESRAVAWFGEAVDAGLHTSDYFLANNLYADLGEYFAKKFWLSNLRSRRDYQALQDRVRELLGK